MRNGREEALNQLQIGDLVVNAKFETMLYAHTLQDAGDIVCACVSLLDGPSGNCMFGVVSGVASHHYAISSYSCISIYIYIYVLCP